MRELMLFAGNSHLEFAQTIADYLKVPLHRPDEADRKGKMITWFSNGNVLVDIKVNVRGANCFVIQTQAPNVSDHIMELLWMINALKVSNAKMITAVMPYMPYIRSDKRDHARACIGAALFASLLKTAGADRVLLMDPHFEQIQGFFDLLDIRSEILRSKAIMAHAIRDSGFDLSNAVAVAADMGGAKRVGPMASLLGIDVAVVDKRRVDDSEHAVPSDMAGKVEGKDCYIFEDETASLSTLFETAKFCRLKGAVRVIGFVTHPVLSKPEAVKALVENPYLDELHVANTIPIPEQKMCSKIHVLPVEKYFADMIDLIHRGESVDEYKHRLYEGLPDTEDFGVW